MNWKITLVLCLAVHIYVIIGAFIFQATEKHDYDYWTYYNSILFVLTVVTTIGYGAMTPVTAAGKFAYVLYALIGIPLTILTLVALGQLANKSTKKLLQMSEIFKKHVRYCVILKFVLLVILGHIIFIFLPAIAFHKIEGWHYAESLYFAYTTFTTVGFGDLYPEMINPPMWYKVFWPYWLMTGLAWVASAVLAGIDIAQIVSLKVKGRKADVEMISQEDNKEATFTRLNGSP